MNNDMNDYSYTDEKHYGNNDYKIMPLSEHGKKNYIDNINSHMDANKFDLT